MATQRLKGEYVYNFWPNARSKVLKRCSPYHSPHIPIRKIIEGSLTLEVTCMEAQAKPIFQIVRWESISPIPEVGVQLERSHFCVILWSHTLLTVRTRNHPFTNARIVGIGGSKIVGIGFGEGPNLVRMLRGRVKS